MYNNTYNESYTKTPSEYLDLSPPMCDRPGLLLCNISKWIWTTVPLAMLFLATVGNGLNVWVLTRARMRKYSTTVYLLCLSVSDTVCIWACVLFSASLTFTTSDVRDWSMFNCVLQSWVVYTTAGFSSWLLVLITIERTLFTTFPVFAKAKMNPKNASTITLIMLTVLSLFASPLLFGYDMQMIETQVPHGNDFNTVRKNTCVYVSDEFKAYITVTWPYLAFIFLNSCPMCLVVIGNIVIITTLKLQQKKRQRLSHRESISNRKRSSATKMLFVLSAFFVCTASPYGVLAIIHSLIAFVPYSQESAIIQFSDAVVYCLLLSNFAFNFYLYFISGTVFKREWTLLKSEVKLKYTNMYHQIRSQNPCSKNTHDVPAAQ